jgi:hypothetical protein
MASTLPFRQEINQNGEWDMARVNRREVLSDGEIQVVHCVNRCVRRGFLCGVDELTGKNYEHRRQWMRNRLEFLAGIFAADVLGFSVMSNHLHVILRNRPDVVKTWSDAEVARRWWNLFPQRRNKDGSPAEPADTELNHLMANAETLAELRARLSSISWFMRCTSEVIARMANAEDECTASGKVALKQLFFSMSRRLLRAWHMWI